MTTPVPESSRGDAEDAGEGVVVHAPNVKTVDKNNAAFRTLGM
jgi:hypothetical protein